MLGLRQYLKECSDHAQNSRVIAYISLAIAAFGFIQNILPLVNVDTSSLSGVPRLPVPWALTIFMAGFITVVVVGGYHRAVAEQTKRDNDVRRLQEQVTDVPRLHVVDGGFYNDVRLLQKLINDASFGKQVGMAELSCLHVKFKNDPKRSTVNSIARNILAEMAFYDAVSESLICSVRGRWGDTPEPPRLLPHQTTADALATVNFEIGQERELDIAFKYPDERECFAMSNETYGTADWRYPKQEISCNQLKVRVRLRGVGVDASWEFWFENPNRGELRPMKHQAVSAAS